MAAISAAAAVIVQYPDAEQWPCHASWQMTEFLPLWLPQMQNIRRTQLHNLPVCAQSAGTCYSTATGTMLNTSNNDLLR